MISFLIGILSGCSHTTSTHTIQKDLSKNQIIEINYDDVLKKINQKEDFVLYIGRPDCKDCQEFEPYLKKYLKKNPPINEQMIKTMMSGMGRTPTQKQVNQMMKQMNKFM